MTSAAGMAMGGLRPVVAVYSTFFSWAFDQAVYDVGLHRLPVICALDRAGITGDDGPSHHGVLDMALCLQVPGMTILAPSSRREVGIMLLTALEMQGPVALRFPKGAAHEVGAEQVGEGLHARQVRAGGGEICILAVGKMVAASEPPPCCSPVTGWTRRCGMSGRCAPWTRPCWPTPPGTGSS